MLLTANANAGVDVDMDVERRPISSRTRSQQVPVPINNREATTSTTTNDANAFPRRSNVSSPADLEETMLLIAVPAAPSEHLAQTMRSNSSSSSNADEPFGLFHSAFAPVCFDEDPTRGRNLGLAFCCYNLALCVHAELYRAEKLGQRSVLLTTNSSWEQRAKLLDLVQANYHRVFRLLFVPQREQQQQQERNRPDGPVLVLLATMNNLAHFCQTFVRHQPPHPHHPPHQQHSSYSQRMQQCARWMQRLVHIKMEEQAQVQAQLQQQMQQQQQRRRRRNNPMPMPMPRMIPPPPISRDFHFFIQAVQRYNAYDQHERWLDRVQLQHHRKRPAPAA